jgi:hypothetical protein
MFEREMDFVLFEARTEFFALRAYRPIFVRTKMMAVIWDVAPCTPEDTDQHVCQYLPDFTVQHPRKRIFVLVAVRTCNLVKEEII